MHRQILYYLKLTSRAATLASLTTLTSLQSSAKFSASEPSPQQPSNKSLIYLPPDPPLHPLEYNRDLIFRLPDYRVRDSQANTTFFLSLAVFLSVSAFLGKQFGRVYALGTLLAFPVMQYGEIKDNLRALTDVVLHQDKETVTLHYGFLLSQSKTVRVDEIKLSSGTHARNGQRYLTVGGTELYLPPLSPKDANAYFDNWDLLLAVFNGDAEKTKKYTKVNKRTN